MAPQPTTEIRVWDSFVRIAHWTLVFAFLVAYLTGDDTTTVHVWAGYTIGALVVARLLWGFVGPRHARFSDFVTGPVMPIRYLSDLLLSRAKRHVGHSPAGGAMVVALLVFLAATVTTGLMEYAAKDRAGPLAPLYTQSTTVVQATGEEREGQGEGREGAGSLGEVHETLANITLGLIVLHVLGVLLASFVHRENLVGAMISGRKRSE